MGKHRKGYWIVVVCVCIIAGVFFYTIQYADYDYDYKIVPGRGFTMLSYLQGDGSQNKIKCYGNVMETQDSIYHYKVQKENFSFAKSEYYGVWLSCPGEGKDFSLVYAYDSNQHQHIQWHSKRNNSSFSQSSVTIAEDGTSTDKIGVGLEEPLTGIACAAIVYLRIKLLQKLLVGYVVFEAILLMIGYLLYKKTETICNFMHKEPAAYRIKTMRKAGCILPLCGAAAIFLIRLLIS